MKSKGIVKKVFFLKMLFENPEPLITWYLAHRNYLGFEMQLHCCKHFCFIALSGQFVQLFYESSSKQRSRHLENV